MTIVDEWTKRNAYKILGIAEDTEIFCTACSKKVLTKECQRAILKNNKKVVVGKCPECYNICIKGE